MTDSATPINKHIKKPLIRVSQLKDGHMLSLLVPAI